ncbi:putative aldouronate transport system substrate-binding protein [Paenibacillus sp. UNCCL117]|uniref:extracellular solute-binding protein n=1 Tax=unclassified Paenibacillus TaxID=185978 RepID=UPI00089057BF|nr:MULTISPECIES: extracellular solute-binding protein [unclassified Paenibacillus]SDD11652.1 putative aldouronate transport system substrate-binding protein [Paenibacillus sp. cl123]SFW33617.1 putative aldouronate transport system substrate-binding protein [Paenibacillus sp. UNCCL117]
MNQGMVKPALLALTALSVVVGGCSGGSKETTNTPATPTPAAPAAQANYGDTGGLKLPIVDKPTTLTWMLVSDNAKLPDSMVVKEIEKRTGIKLDIQAYSSQTFKDKLKVVVASGKLPDLFHGLTVAEINKMGAQGALAPINNYLDKLPNFKKLYVDTAENNWVMKSWSDEKNNMYIWPIYGLNRDVNHGFLYRKDIFDKHGIKEWTNTEEFYQALKKLKEAYPQSYPYASKTKENIFRDWAYGWGTGGTGYPAYYDEKAKTWKLAYTQPEFKDQLDFMKKLYAEGLLDPEFITDTDASWTAKMTTNNKSFVTFDWIGRLDAFANQVKSQNPEYNLRYANPVGPTGNVRSLPKISNFGNVVSNGANKEIALKLLDYLTSPSGSSLITMGIEGETYTLENGKLVYPELKDAPIVDLKALETKYGMWLEGMYFRPDKRSVYYKFSEKEQEAQDKIVKNNKFEPADPELKFTDAETKTLAELRTAIDKAANEFSTKYVMKKEFGDAQWNEWLQTAEKMGAQKFIDAYNAAQQRYNEAK